MLWLSAPTPSAEPCRTHGAPERSMPPKRRSRGPAAAAASVRGRIAQCNPAVGRFASNIIRRTRPITPSPTHFHYQGWRSGVHDAEDFPCSPSWKPRPRHPQGVRLLMASEQAALVHIQIFEIATAPVEPIH